MRQNAPKTVNSISIYAYIYMHKVNSEAQSEQNKKDSSQVPELSAMEWTCINGHKEESNYVDQYSRMDAGSHLQGSNIRGQSAVSLDQTHFCNSPSCSWRWRPIFSGDILKKDLIYIFYIASDGLK